MPDFVTVIAVLAVILIFAALASGLVERSPISFPLMFLGLGLAIGEGGFGLIDMGPHDPVLEVVATLTLLFALRRR